MPPLLPARLQSDETPAGPADLTDPGAEALSEEWLQGHSVTAVLVAHDGARWLPQALAALAAQVHPPDRVVAVDTGSTDAGPALLREALGEARVRTAPVDTGFGAAVALGEQAVPVAHDERTQWLWLLHDDCAPEPDCLLELLRRAEGSPSVAVVGAKARDWDDPRLLVEVGLTTDAGGRRETNLERREYDQGQHDAVDEVLAVGTAGMLVRREVYDALGGLAPELPLFREDVDLGWRVNAAGHRVVVAPAAVVRHARAVSTGRRAADAVRGRPTEHDRRHALEVVVAHAGPAGMWVTLPRLLLLSVVRALGFVLIRRPRQALDELAAARDLAVHPGRLRALRHERRRTRTRPVRETRHLLAPRTARLRRVVDVLRDAVGGGAGQVQTVLAEPTGDSRDDGLPPDDGNGAGLALLRFLRRPPVALLLGLTALAVVAERSLVGPGRLYGGRLLPSVAGVGELFERYAGDWSTTGPGSGEPAAPFLALLGVAGVPLLGKASLAVALLLLASVPLAGLTAWLALRPTGAPTPLRLWAAATYALLPPLTGSIASGRLGPAVTAVLLPLLLVACFRVLVPGRAPSAGAALGGRHAWAAGLLLAVVVAFSPGLYPVALILLALGVVTVLVRPVATGAGADAAGSSPERRPLAVLVVAAVPVLLLLPWSVHVLSQPSLLLLGIEPATASTALVERAVPPSDLLLLHPGGPGLPPVWSTAALVLIALVGLAHPVRSRARAVLGAFGVAGVAWVVAVLVNRGSVAPLGGREVPGWPGEMLLLAGAALVLAAVIAADGVVDRLREASFGWRQGGAALLAVAAVAGTVASGATWAVRGVDGPLARQDPTLLPAFAEAALTPGDRVLYLRTGEDGRTAYELSGAEGSRLGDGGVSPDVGQLTRLDDLVEELLAPGGGTTARDLATYAVRFVVVPTPVDAEVAKALDAQGGLARQSFEGPVRLWSVAVPSPAVGVLPPALTAEALELDGPTGETLRAVQPQALPLDPLGGSLALGGGPEGRLLVLAQARDAGWRASLDGRELTPVTAWGWAQAFELPADGGRLEVGRADGGRTLALVLQVLGLVAVLVLAAPPVSSDDDDDVDPIRDLESSL